MKDDTSWRVEEEQEVNLFDLGVLLGLLLLATLLALLVHGITSDDAFETLTAATGASAWLAWTLGKEP